VIVQSMTFLAVGASQSEVSGVQQAAMEANLSVEVAMIVLDAVTLYVNSFKVMVISTGKGTGPRVPPSLRAGFGGQRIGPICFLAQCHNRRLYSDLS